MQQLRYCVFCGGHPLSEEEFFPMWIRAILPDTSKPGYTISNISQVGTYTPQYTTSTVNRNGKFSNKTVKEFCRVCNNGWMSRLENAARPLLSSWILQQQTTIAGEDRATLIRWATLRIIVMDMAETNWLINKETRQKFYNDQLPIKNLTIWIARADIEGGYMQSVESISISPVILPRGQYNTRSYLWIAGGLMIWALYAQNENLDFNPRSDSGGGQTVCLADDGQPIDTRTLTVWGTPTITYLSQSFLRLSGRTM